MSRERTPTLFDRQWLVYVLTDPRTEEVRYVGVTVRGLNRRLNEHVSRARTGARSYRDSWIRQLLALGLRPDISRVGFAWDDDWVEAEQRWVAHYRAAGARLTNLTDGGEGNSGYVPSEETRAKWRAARRGKKYAPGRVPAMLGKHHTEEARAAIAAASASRKQTDAAKAKISAARKGKPLSKEHVEKMAAAKRGRTLPDWHRAKIRAAATGHRPVRQLSTGAEFPSIGEAARRIGVNKRDIVQALAKGCRCRGSYWEYAGA
jgi:hypothetical protein